jgi:hypothetical protein
MVKDGNKFRGKIVEDMTRDELIAALNYTIEYMHRQNEEQIRRSKFLEEIRAKKSKR